MAFHLIDKHDELAGGMITTKLRCDPVFTPGPGQHVGERCNSPYAGGCVNDRYLARVVGLDGRNVARIVDGETLRQTGRNLMAFGRLAEFRRRRQLEQSRCHAQGVLVLGLDPPGPIVQQAVADRSQAPVYGIPEPVPNFRFGEHVCRPTLLGGDVAGFAPIVPGGVPHRERAVGVCVHDDTGKGWAARLADPALLTPREFSPPAKGPAPARERETECLTSSLHREVEPDGRTSCAGSLRAATGA